MIQSDDFHQKLDSDDTTEGSFTPQVEIVGVDLFAGAGGMSLGAQWAGISTQLAVELDPWAFKTYCQNHPHTFAVRCDITGLKDVRIPKTSKPLIIYGGPPCQGFSTSNQRTRSKKNKLNWMFEYFFGVVENVRPDWVVFENVAGITHTAEGVFVKKIISLLHRCGYKTSEGLLNAADFGVPQRRTRYFLIGARDVAPPKLPVPKTGTRITVDEAIRDLPSLSCGAAFDRLPYRSLATAMYAKTMRGQLSESTNHLVTSNAPNIVERYAHIPQGGNWKNIPSKMMSNYANRNRCHTGIYRRLTADEPSVVIGNFRKNMLIHPYEHRGLSVREAARLQSFPDWYEFFGSIGFQQQQVGNAVPPLLAKAVFQEIVFAIKANSPSKAMS
jgi:DNA (cytosine-5)-methyltransferase 1